MLSTIVFGLLILATLVGSAGLLLLQRKDIRNLETELVQVEVEINQLTSKNAELVIDNTVLQRRLATSERANAQKLDFIGDLMAIEKANATTIKNLTDSHELLMRELEMVVSYDAQHRLGGHLVPVPDPVVEELPLVFGD